MIEKIFIPTLNRVDNQITYNHLPKELKDRVVMVVQKHEADKYTYPCEYLVLDESINPNNYLAIAHTRKRIYEEGRNIKYAVIDDDLFFGRRNQKYFGGPDNMEKSKRICTDEDIIEMFDLFDQWLDEESITLCGPAHEENYPLKQWYQNNCSLSSAMWINGKDFSDVLDEFELTKIKCGEDTCFILHLLSYGYQNRVSQEFFFKNNSVHKKIHSEIWDQQSFENTHRDHQILEQMFPGIYNIVYEEDGTRKIGGFRGYGKVSVKWKKALNSRKRKNLDTFL